MTELLVLIAIAFVVIGPVLAVIALARTHSLDALRRAVAALEAEVAELKRRVRAATRPSPGPEPPPPEVEAAPVRLTQPPPRQAQLQPPQPPEAPPRPQPPPPPEAPRVDWERWIGIRGAAVLGGIVLALAG